MAQEVTIRVPTRFKPHVLGALAVGLAAIALAIPGVAAGYSSTGSDLAGPASASTPAKTHEVAVVTRRDGSRAVPFVANVSGESSTAAAGSEFDWGDAAIGAGAALGIVALFGATGVAIRSRRRVVPSAG
jgi:hypothetical protein